MGTVRENISSGARRLGDHSFRNKEKEQKKGIRLSNLKALSGPAEV